MADKREADKPLLHPIKTVRGHLSGAQAELAQRLRELEQQLRNR